MAKLYFSYAAMNAGKSTILLQAAYNYRERGMEVLLLTSALYKDDEDGHISSRIGIGADAVLYDKDTDIFGLIADELDTHALSAVFVDEAQFLSKEQVWQLAEDSGSSEPARPWPTACGRIFRGVVRRLCGAACHRRFLAGNPDDLRVRTQGDNGHPARP